MHSVGYNKYFSHIARTYNETYDSLKGLPGITSCFFCPYLSTGTLCILIYDYSYVMLAIKKKLRRQISKNKAGAEILTFTAAKTGPEGHHAPYSIDGNPTFPKDKTAVASR